MIDRYGTFVRTRTRQDFSDANGASHAIGPTSILPAGDQTVVMKMIGGPRDDGRYKVQVETVLPQTQVGVTLTAWIEPTELEGL